jgi:hypothetical protein
MAVVDAVTELVKEELDLVRSHCMFVLAQVFLEIILDQFKYQIELFFVRDVDDFSQPVWKGKYWTMLG